MKGIILTAIVLASTSAFASKARVSSLQYADHLVDSQTLLVNPQHANLLGQYLTFEMGTPGAGAEGGALLKLGEGKLGVYVGHDNSTPLRDGTVFIKQRNPVEVTYGIGNMGFAGSLSTTDDQANNKKETTLVGKFGMAVTEAFDFYAHLTAIGEAKDTTPGAEQKLNTVPTVLLGGNFTSGDNRFFGKLGYGQNKLSTGGVDTDVNGTLVQLGWLNRSFKNQDADIYFGSTVIYTDSIAAAKTTSTELPIFAGLEYTMNSWAVFRGSVSQNFLLGETKVDNAGTVTKTSVNSNTTVAAGLGLKYNQLTFDGALTAATNGNVNGNAFITQAGVTYNF